MTGRFGGEVKMMKKRKGLYKIWAIIIVTAFVPFVAAFLIVYQASTRSIGEQNHQHNLYILQKAVQLHDSFISQSQKQLQQLSRESSLIHMTYNTGLEIDVDGALDTTQPMVKELYEFAVTTPYVSNVYYYNQRKNLIISSAGELYAADAFYDVDWMEALQQVPLGVKYFDYAREVIHPQLGTRRYFTVLCRVPYTTWDQSAAIVVNYSVDEIYQKLINHMQYQEGEIWIFNRYGELLAGPAQAEALQEQIPLMSTEGQWTGPYEGDKKVFTYVTSPYSGCKFVYAVPEGVVQNKTRKVAVLAGFVASMAFLVLSLGMYVIASYLYTPLANMIKGIGVDMPGQTKSTRKILLEEYHILDQTYDRLLQDNKNLRRANHELQNYKDAFLLRKILRGVPNVSVGESSLSWMDGRGKNPAWVVLCVTPGRAEKGQENLYNAGRSWCTEMSWCAVSENVVAGVVRKKENGSAQIEEKELKIWVRENVGEEIGFLWITGPCSGWDGIRKAYLSLMRKMLRREADGNVEEASTAMLWEESECYWDEKRKQEIMKWMKSRSQKELHGAMEDYANWLQAQPDDQRNLQEWVSFMKELDGVYGLYATDGQNRQKEEELLQDLSHTEKWQTAVFLGEQLIHRYAQSMSDYLQGKNTRKIEMMIEFMKNHLDKDFSLQDVTDAAEISVSYGGKIFKDAMGCNVMEYCNRLRVEKAKRLLRDNEKGLAEIAGLVGFNSVQTFSRAFKKMEGITPGQYRELQQK